MKNIHSSSASSDDFKARYGWFEKFKRRTEIHCVVRHGEAASSDNEAGERYKAEFVRLVEEEGYISHLPSSNSLPFLSQSVFASVVHCDYSRPHQ